MTQCMVCSNFPETPAHEWRDCPRLQGGDPYNDDREGPWCRETTGRGRCLEPLRSDGTCPADYRHRGDPVR